jgi:DNA-binding NarL/FixJ family response regulator
MTHVSNILGKLGLASRTQAALYARDHGIDGAGTGG